MKNSFLITCPIFRVHHSYTGLAYSDMALLTEKDISLGIDGNKWIIIRRKKTDIRSVIPLLPMALTILNKYCSDKRNNKLLPCYAIQKFNSYILGDAGKWFLYGHLSISSYLSKLDNYSLLPIPGKAEPVYLRLITSLLIITFKKRNFELISDCM